MYLVLVVIVSLTIEQAMTIHIKYYHYLICIDMFILLILYYDCYQLNFYYHMTKFHDTLSYKFGKLRPTSAHVQLAFFLKTALSKVILD